MFAGSVWLFWRWARIVVEAVRLGYVIPDNEPPHSRREHPITYWSTIILFLVLLALPTTGIYLFGARLLTGFTKGFYVF
jgi:Ni,Fe-hydrogenase I cytochrome b subunit